MLDGKRTVVVYEKHSHPHTSAAVKKAMPRRCNEGGTYAETIGIQGNARGSEKCQNRGQDMIQGDPRRKDDPRECRRGSKGARIVKDALG